MTDEKTLSFEMGQPLLMLFARKQLFSPKKVITTVNFFKLLIAISKSLKTGKFIITWLADKMNKQIKV